MADPRTGWWAEEIGPDEWVPTIQLRNQLCLQLPAWFDTEDECMHFIREHLAGAGELLREAG